MRRSAFMMLRPALGCALMCLIPKMAVTQTAWPPLCFQHVEWTSGIHHTAVTLPIEAPCSSDDSVSISGVADAEWVSGTRVHLAPGFHAGDLTNDGQFHGHVDAALDPDADLALITPEPATHIVDGLVHVEKWEKLELGLQLPQEYQDAIGRFFAHYYSYGSDTVATPGNVDALHDLNPYADDSLQVVMTLTSPTGEKRMKWGFYLREAQWTDASDTARLAAFTTNPLDAYRIRFRFAPDEEGLWRFSLAARAPHTLTTTDAPLPALDHSGYAFFCEPPLDDNHGFLHVNTKNRRLLQFEDGTPYLGLGPNMADQRHGDLGLDTLAPFGTWYTYFRHDYRIMKQTMEQLHSVGGNYLRMMFIGKNFTPEWVNLGVYDGFLAPSTCADGSGHVSYTGNCQYSCWVFDSLLAHARVNDLYIQLCIDPDMPGPAYQVFGWGHNAYVLNFLEPARDSITGRFDLKNYFFSPDENGQPRYDSGVFYYWKRRYKYIMSRWGYSVNIAAIEPFNEINQMITYEVDTLSDAETICDENLGAWPRDTALPGTVDDWLTRLIGYVRGEVDTLHPATSALGESNKLFLLSFTQSQPANTGLHDFYRPFTNPQLDLMDVHQYAWPDETEMGLHDWRREEAFDQAQVFRNTYPYLSAPFQSRKPFVSGECNHFSGVDFVGWPYPCEEIFHNYDVSFHNELWSAAFSGKFAAGSTWLWHRVFWWPYSLLHPPQDPNNTQQTQLTNNVLGYSNNLDFGLLFPITIVNRTLHHHFKPLSDLLGNASLRELGLFDGYFTANKAFSDLGVIEAYYIKDSTNAAAIGWANNRNAWAMNNFYVANTDTTQNYFGCTAPTEHSVMLPGFLNSTPYHITWYATHMNDTIHPVDTVYTTTAYGSLQLDMSTARLGDTIQFYLDTLHSDYAFIVTQQPFLRSAQSLSGDDEPAATNEWDFTLYPNPAQNYLYLRLPEGPPKEITLFDFSGRRVASWRSVSDVTVRLSIGQLAPSCYSVVVSDGKHLQVKRLIVQ